MVVELWDIASFVASSSGRKDEGLSYFFLTRRRDTLLCSALIAGGTIEKEGRVLLVKHSDPRKKDYSHWLLPAGRVEPKESLIEALHREMQEELGIKVIVEGVLSEHTDDYTGQRFVNYLCHPASNQISLGDELSEYRWVSMDDVEGIESIHPGLKRFLLDFFMGKQVVTSSEA